jgi:hypothetical protein
MSTLEFIGLPGLLLLALASTLILIIPFWKLLPKFGYPGPLALLVCFPLAVPVLLWILAFSTPVADKGNNQ